MSFDKAIAHGKVRRKPYRGSKAFDRTCRNHGTCDYCRGSRLHSRLKAERIAKEKVREWDISARYRVT